MNKAKTLITLIDEGFFSELEIVIMTLRDMGIKISDRDALLKAMEDYGAGRKMLDWVKHNHKEVVRKYGEDA